MKQIDLATVINLLNHTLKLKQLGTLLEWRQANKERMKTILNSERLVLLPSITIF
jgi:hypothetical protein